MATVELVVLQISAAGLSSELVAQDGVERATRVWAKIVAPMGAERPLQMEVIKQRQRAVLGRYVFFSTRNIFFSHNFL